MGALAGAGELGAGAIVPLVRAVSERADRVRLLYLYPTTIDDATLDAVTASPTVAVAGCKHLGWDDPARLIEVAVARFEQIRQIGRAHV